MSVPGSGAKNFFLITGALNNAGNPKNTVITFNAANQNLTNGSLVPPENKLTAFADNSVRTQILSNKGHVITSTAIQNGWFMSVDDLLVVGNGSTWKMRWKMDFSTADGGTSFQLPYILTEDITVPGPVGFDLKGVLIMNIQADGRHVAFLYQNTSATFITFLTATTGNNPEGTTVTCTAERTATQFILIFDEDGATTLGKQEAAVNLSLVKSHTVNKFSFGDANNNGFFGTLNIDDITYPNAS